ncbi:MAG: DUF5610 domain-containing protein [Gammaproteobacteria bacterium]|nr:DUF5610 domain-containing protein [Gammaproteobacteria bacterium]
MMNINSDLMKGLDLFTSRQQSSSQKAGAVSAVQGAQVDSIHIEKSEQQSFTFFYRSVHSKLEQSLESKQNKLEKELAEKQLQQQEKRADVAANNILKFIEHQLNQDVKDGASLVAIESRIAAALEGFNQGFDEANGTLKDMELLSPNLEKEIGMTKEKVLAGIEQLKQEFLGSEPDADQYVSDETAEQPTTTPAQSISYMEGFNAGQMNDFSFELTTADGDKVTINTSSIQAYAQQSGLSEQGAATQMAYQSYAGYAESNFSFSVGGELDQQELEAINNLLNNVNDLAADFYSGDVSKAFDKALELNYDSSEISEFSISLTQIKNFTAYQAYQTDKPLFNPTAINDLKPLAEFSNNLRNSFESLTSLFEQPKLLMTEVMSSINQLQKPSDYPAGKTDFVEFATRLLDKFEQVGNSYSAN